MTKYSNSSVKQLQISNICRIFQKNTKIQYY